MKKSIASLELAALINELQILLRGTVSQIYHPNEKEIFIQIHANGSKYLLKIISGKFLCLTNKKETALTPTSFCMQLRKYLDHAYLKSIQQKNGERIALLEFEKKEKFYLIIEFFSKGNIILADKDYHIIGTLEQQLWKDRIIKVKEQYKFPATGLNWKEMTEKQFSDMLSSSEKKNLATSLATELGLGGIYAEELCVLSEVNKDLPPTEVDKKSIKQLFTSFQEILKLIKKPHGYFYTEQITPFPLKNQQVLKETPTYNEAIDTIRLEQKTSPYDKKIKTLEKTIESQQESINKQENDIIINTKKADLIYEKYTPILKLLEIVKDLRKTKEWKEVEIELKKEKKIKKVDLKNKKVVLDL